MSVLSGVRIIEMVGIGPGPFCGMLLADMGADVIAVERPGDGGGEKRPGHILHRGKRSITLDLKKPAAVEVMLDLVRSADGLIEGMRPGVMERLGLGPETCLAANPALVYGRVTGWGQTGPLAHAAGHDSNYTALAGALWFASPPDQPQIAPSTMLGDVGGGALYLALGMVAGILRARTDGAGQVIDAAIVDGVANSMNLLLSLHARLGGGFDRGTMAFDASHWARSYKCADGGWINLAPLEPQFYTLLLQKLGLDKDPRYLDGQRDAAVWPELTKEMEHLFATGTRNAWCDLLEGTDCCFAPVLSPSEAAQHSHMAARGAFHVVDEVLQAGPAPRFFGTPSKDPQSVPARGIHTREVLEELGVSTERFDQLLAMQACG